MRINKRSARVFSGKPVTESSGVESSRIHKEQFLNHVNMESNVCLSLFCYTTMT